MKIRVWSDEDDVMEVIFDSGSIPDLERLIRRYVTDRYDDDWSDHCEVFVQIDEQPRRQFSVLIQREVTFSISETSR